VALRSGGMLYWLLSDHLGSTAVTLSGTTEAGEVRYRAFGATRFTSGTTPTSYRFTGQREEAALGLYFYNARWYDPVLGHFLSPDTVVPDPGNALDYHRYAYVRFNPLKYTDPSGHWLETVWDIANIAWDIHEIRQDPGNLWNWGALVVDVGAALLPGVPAFAGVVVHGGKALARSNDILDMVRAVSWSERFAGASPEIRRGIAWLEQMVQSERIPAAYRRGFASELLRAEEYFKAGKLQAVEAVVEGGRVDLILVPTKSWRSSTGRKVTLLKT
jgi:RHS repeat-associated protein